MTTLAALDGRELVLSDDSRLALPPWASAVASPPWNAGASNSDGGQRVGVRVGFVGRDGRARGLIVPLGAGAAAVRDAVGLVEAGYRKHGPEGS